MKFFSVGPQPHAAFGVDVSSSAAVSDLLAIVRQTFSGVPSIAVNCAGITRDNFLLKLDEASFDKVIAVNLKVHLEKAQVTNFPMKQSVREKL